MHVLIVHADAVLGALWQERLEVLGAQVQRVGTADTALGALEQTCFDVIVLDVMLDGGGALAVADTAQFRHPDTNLVFLTDTRIFSDGSIFGYSANARALIQTATPPDDVAAIVYHYGGVTADRAALTDQ